MKIPKKVRCSRCATFMKRFNVSPSVRVFRCNTCITTSVCTDGSVDAGKVAAAMMADLQGISDDMGIETQVTVKASGDDGV